MTLFIDLDDDCLLEVLDWLTADQLIKLQRVNKRMKQLATRKMLQFKAIRLNEANSDCSSHLNVSWCQVLVLDQLFKALNQQNWMPLRRDVFLRLLNKFAGVKSIDFSTDLCEFPDGLLLETVLRLPQLECVKLKSVVVKEAGWDQVLDEIGPKMVHFVRENYSNTRSEICLLEKIAEKCPKIEQLELKSLGDLKLAPDLVAAIKRLPNGCRVKVKCDKLVGSFEDVINELELSYLPSFGQRTQRLSKLRFRRFTAGDGPVVGVIFAGLKRLEFDPYKFDQKSLDFLLASRFPVLEVFSFDASAGEREDNFDRLFQRMASVKKLNVVCYNCCCIWNFRFVKAAVSRLKNLETVQFEMKGIAEGDEELFFIRLEEMIGEFGSLKRVVLKPSFAMEKWRSFKRENSEVRSRVDRKVEC